MQKHLQDCADLGPGQAATDTGAGTCAEGNVTRLRHSDRRERLAGRVPFGIKGVGIFRKPWIAMKQKRRVREASSHAVYERRLKKFSPGRQLLKSPAWPGNRCKVSTDHPVKDNRCFGQLALAIRMTIQRASLPSRACWSRFRLQRTGLREFRPSADRRRLRCIFRPIPEARAERV